MDINHLGKAGSLDSLFGADDDAAQEASDVDSHDTAQLEDLHDFHDDSLVERQDAAPSKQQLALDHSFTTSAPTSVDPTMCTSNAATSAGFHTADLSPKPAAQQQRSLSMPASLLAPRRSSAPAATRFSLANLSTEMRALRAAVWTEPHSCNEADATAAASCANGSPSTLRSELRKRRSDTSSVLSTLRRVAALGAGQFGCVSLVAEDSGRKYALKALWKGQLLATGQAHTVLRERDLLRAVEHPFVARLERSFQDERRLYLLMEPVLGGELFALLHIVGHLDESMARFYAACVYEVLRYLHERGIVYRDLKPENLLLDASGYPKLVDFGVAKRLGGCGAAAAESPTTRTICGTPEYMAPEMVQGHAYSYAVDWWAAGMLLFEMVSGSPAFRGESREQVYDKILHAPPRLLQPVSQPCSDLISALLAKDPDSRPAWADISGAAWFDGLDWAALATKALPAPWVPKIAHDADTSNVIQLDKYVTPANDASAADWDCCLAEALRQGVNPFEDFSIRVEPL